LRKRLTAKDAESAEKKLKLKSSVCSAGSAVKNQNERKGKSENLLVLGDATFSGDGLIGVWPDDYPVAVLERRDSMPQRAISRSGNLCKRPGLGEAHHPSGTL